MFTDTSTGIILIIIILLFPYMAKGTDNNQDLVPNSRADDGPGDGFTILSAKSLFLGQKVHSLS